MEKQVKYKRSVNDPTTLRSLKIEGVISLSLKMIPTCMLAVISSDHGIQRYGTNDVVEPLNDQLRRSLLQDLNRHAAVVLEGRCIDVESEGTRIVAEALTRAKQVSKADGEITKDANQERLERMSLATEMEDLQAPQNFPLAPLSIKDPRDYFESQQGNILSEPRGAKASKRNVHEAYGLLKESILENRMTGLSDPLIKPEVSFEVFSSLTRTISTAKNIVGKNPRESFLDRLPKSTKDEVIQTSSSVLTLDINTRITETFLVILPNNNDIS
ncbi:probable RNA polymerase II transcription factor B subunit 1-3 isoform X1 [Arabidopsis lyrata subsp. lyrata]|uniref:probable RNA polymerase II transcription factor B subunit 1-3 isoform X1 n=2 Tax=Arabidopsis lyrata subsp. lyrata TaxID=81972 RepID=UPI000A29DF32|nr:probable RNA polymerase II transcription factor B subunit 1-3 isoform X1 [Arabidopsis lyrata subsp. lyrata]XP_020880082.1 probable RNA polymerase II transcription factor B subunit 1-3 isoform X1 [Arabidopsis lyrata subsp. lyrata]|eukprot:XP_020880079.1 probable RNA polymerase II transcription factor B subunit 1-3 isoform X1 [Arabidopsis lyrata subsp. lyrata]